MAEERLCVFLDGRRIGDVRQDRNGTLSFSYDTEYMGAPDAIPLSLSMPLNRQTHTQRATRAYLRGLLPDSEPALVRLARGHGVSPNSPFGLLREIGRDAAGAVQILPEGIDATDAATRQGDIEWLDQTALDDLLASLAEHPDDWDPSRAVGRWSLAGAQSKVALYRTRDGLWGVPHDSTPTTHILKPSIPRLRGHHLNEHLCLRAARHLGLPAARTEILASDRFEVLVAERFDRRMDGHRGQRLHQEDMCQALAVVPGKKYQEDGGPGITNIADLLRTLPGQAGPEDARRFFDYLLFNVAIGATDAHAKNFGLMLLGRASIRLAPLYDVASYRPYGNGEARSAMKVGEHWLLRSVDRADWVSVGRRLGLTQADVEQRLEASATAIPAAFERAAVGESIPVELRREAEQLAAVISAMPHRGTASGSR